MKTFLKFVPIAFMLSAFVSGAMGVSAQSESELRERIEAKNKEISTLEAEIANYQKQIVETGKQANTLSGALKTLELTRKKLTTDISLTQKKIDSVTLTINSLGSQISDKEGRISLQKEAISLGVRELSSADQVSLLEALLTYEDLGDFWARKLEQDQINGAMHSRVGDLKILKDDLSAAKDEEEGKRRELERLKNQLADQRKIVEANKRETDKLLSDTKNKESEYKKLLAEREAKRAAFQKELSEYESQLRLLIDPDSFPRPGLGILAWPTDNPFVTQEFGDTAFSRSNPQAYSGRGHNGIDLRASPGSPIKAALSGVVFATGDTDTVCPGASYGKWILIKHANGLSTLYAHLSLIRVGEGQNVTTRELIGYSGSTGYATGPHLHFALYASQGVQVISRKSRICIGTYTIPVADLKAYLNPLLYL